MVLRTFVFASVLVIMGAANAAGQDAYEELFAGHDKAYLGTAFLREGANSGFQDDHPHVIAIPDASLPEGYLYRMYHHITNLGDDSPFGQRLEDLAPERELYTTDRIVMSESTDGGFTFGEATVVYQGFAGTLGDRCDDHLVGSPVVVKVGDTWLMIYEAYGLWVTPLNRVWSSSRSDTHVATEFSGRDYDYVSEFRNLGFAPLFKKAGTRPIYAGEVTYYNGHVNRFLTKDRDSVLARTDVHGVWRPLKVDDYTGEPLPEFWLYTGSGAGRKKIVTAWDGTFWNTFATDDVQSYEGRTFVEELGYAAESLTPDSPDMEGSLLNNIAMAYSTDGVNWAPFDGPGPKGELFSPADLWQSSYDAGAERIVRAYGAGYPQALVRNGYLEVFFQDESLDKVTFRRMRVPVDQWDERNAWADAEMVSDIAVSSYPGLDIKWSPALQRYFGTTFVVDKSFTPQRQWPRIIWSQENPSWEDALRFLVPDQMFPETGDDAWPMPDNRWAAGGCIAGTDEGHILEDFVFDASPYIPFHVYFSATPGIDDSHSMDIDHTLVFGYPHKLDGTIVVEAESDATETGAEGRRWEVISKDGASGGLAVQVPDEGIADAPSRSFQVSVPQPGRFYVWVRAIATNGGNNSVHVGLDGKIVSTGKAIYLAKGSDWHWSNNRMAKYGGGPAYFDFDAAGTNTISLIMREDGAIVDQILLTMDESFRP